jgi:E3 ubiquitin-protein ligase SspH2
MLQTLDLRGNRLEALPESMGQLRMLTTLKLDDNLALSGIPNSLLELSSSCRIYLTRCGLSANVLERLREATQADSYSGPCFSFSIADRTSADEKSIQRSLNDLYAIVKKKPATFTNLRETLELRSWLNRLTDIADFKAGKKPRKALVKKVIHYVHQANDDPEFRTVFYEVIQDASQTCGDRVTLSILHLSIAYQLVTIGLKDMKKLADFLIKGPWTIDILKGMACQKISTLRFFDEIEIYLGYPIKLKEALEIPIDVQNMLYFTCSALTPEDLETAQALVLNKRTSQEECTQFLANHATWQKALELHYPEEYQTIVDQRIRSSDSENPNYSEIDIEFIKRLQGLTLKALESL